MSLAGLRKQYNKASQMINETMGMADATRLDDTYMEMERKIDLTNDLVTALINGTSEYLQPNPATRAKMAAMGAMSKVRGTTKSQSYPQTEGLLADTMSKYGRGLGEGSDLGSALCDASDAFRQLADIKYQLEDVVKHNFLDPITHLQSNELKDVNHHRTKLKGRRLDYDCKRRNKAGQRDEELVQAEEKLEESKRLAEQAMNNVLSNDVEQISQLRALVDAQMDYHQQTLSVLEGLKNQLERRIREASDRPRHDHSVVPVLMAGGGTTSRSRSPVSELSANIGAATINGSVGSRQSVVTNSTAGAINSNNPVASGGGGVKKGAAQCKALYDFEAQNPGELEFKEGAMIELLSQIDENWYEGRLNGKSGFFPITYVQVLVPL